jgi:hypothetical protein
MCKYFLRHPTTNNLTERCHRQSHFISIPLIPHTSLYDFDNTETSWSTRIAGKVAHQENDSEIEIGEASRNIPKRGISQLTEESKRTQLKMSSGFQQLARG